MQAQGEQPDKKAPLEYLLRDAPAQPLAGQHAGQRRQQRIRGSAAAPRLKLPCNARLAASATVDAVNARPSACTSASRASPSPCRYGTAGITKTPVAAVTNPVTAPAMGPSQASCRAGTRSCSENSPASAYSISATPSATTAQAPLSCGSRAPPARVPAMTAASMGHKRRSRARRPGPAASCHTFVTIDGTISRAAACTGGMTRLSVPMATVGKPQSDYALDEASDEEAGADSQQK